ncbi:hypothetical protein MMC21_006984 [Puttea exsequens]|nr:hypothetical protein [Puttea exsequens]
MDNYILPSSAYDSPARLARKHTLNTIIEDEYSEREEDYSEGEGQSDDRGRDKERGQHLEPSRSAQSTSPVPSLTSSVSSYYKSSRRSDDFDDLYDVSDDDSEIALSVMTSISARSSNSLDPPPSIGKQRGYPSLVIPSPRNWPTIQKIQTTSPPVPPKIPLSPAVLSMLAHDLPTASNPPSLVGSLNSDPNAESSAPVTPDTHVHHKSGEIWGQVEAKQIKPPRPELKVRIDDGSGWHNQASLSAEDNVSIRDFAIDLSHGFSDSPVPGSEDGSSDLGVQLPPGALDTLQSLSPDPPLQPEFSSPTVSEKEMEELDWTPPPRPSSADVTPMSHVSDYSISGMSIPSPSDFFSSLKGNARRTWCVNGSPPMSDLPPSTTTAEQFYNCPWRDPPATVEQIIEVEDSGSDTEGPPTARQMPLHPEDPTAVLMGSLVETEAVKDHDENYEQAIQEMAEKSLDRTSVWLAAQTSYMAGLRGTSVDPVTVNNDSNLKRSHNHARNDSLGSPIRKAVRFLESEEAKREVNLVKPAGEGDSMFYHAFQHVRSESRRVDAFRHRHTRSDSVQSFRISLPHEHLAQLQGQFRITKVDRPAPQRPISMMPGKETPEQTAEQKLIARVDRERQALEQINTRVWIVEAARYLNGGKLLNSPATEKLKQVPSLADIENGKVKCPARVLDLGGQPSGDWAWHCSREYQFARVYTATTEHELLDSNIRGPRNHRPTAVPSLWQLPYPSNYFNTISARSLFAFLKTEKLPGCPQDDYDLCLRECMRCLKPGGYLEYFLMDSEIVNAGPLGNAISVEFGFNLRTRGYDPLPTKSFLGRLRRTGFDDIKRAWTFLPIGSPTRSPSALPETPPPVLSSFEKGKVEAVQGPVGTTADAASMAGLVGSWAWEQWMLRLQVEMGKEVLLDGVGKVLEEGKWTGAGWRCLSGWARKPMDSAS